MDPHLWNALAPVIALTFWLILFVIICLRRHWDKNERDLHMMQYQMSGRSCISLVYRHPDPPPPYNPEMLQEKEAPPPDYDLLFPGQMGPGPLEHQELSGPEQVVVVSNPVRPDVEGSAAIATIATS